MHSALPLLIFDLDGVLVDSESISERLFLQALQEDGFSIDRAFNNQYFLGRSLRDCLDTLQEHYGRQPSAAALEGYGKLVETALQSELQPVAFVEQALKELPNPKCVASGSEPNRIETSLAVTGLASYFQNITSSYEVAKGKPSPDVFLRAASKNQYSPDNCLVIEDTIFGVEAGIAAGMQVLCYQPVTALAYSVPEEVLVFSSMKALPDLVRHCSNPS